jgi:MoaA/NifB/PqqE/SkfB family radical SAM enzyme
VRLTDDGHCATPCFVEQFECGLDASICLTWELTYACNQACVHWVSSSGKRGPRELSTAQCKEIIDDLEHMQVFYGNIGGANRLSARTFGSGLTTPPRITSELRFSTNGVRITPPGAASELAASDYVDVQTSLDWATAEVNDAVRGPRSFAMVVRAVESLATSGFKDAKISMVVTRYNVDQLDEFAPLASRYGVTTVHHGCARRDVEPMSGKSCIPPPRSRLRRMTGRRSRAVTCWSFSLGWVPRLPHGRTSDGCVNCVGWTADA